MATNPLETFILPYFIPVAGFIYGVVIYIYNYTFTTGVLNFTGKYSTAVQSNNIYRDTYS